MQKKKVDIIVSCYNEEDNVSSFFNEVKKYIKNNNYIYNIVYVNDGSVDKTYEKIIKLYKQNKNKNIKISYISFVHNFGHEAAMCAGIDKSKADIIIVMDVDLQNPPKKIPEIIDKFDEKVDCVLLKRVKYTSASAFKRFTSRTYYWFSKYILNNKNERDVSDFFALNKKLAKDIKKKYRTRIRFLRSFVQMEAKNIGIVEYESAKRNSGISKYNYFRLMKLAVVSELSRLQLIRDMYRETKMKPIYIIDKNKTKYI